MILRFTNDASLFDGRPGRIDLLDEEGQSVWSGTVEASVLVPETYADVHVLRDDGTRCVIRATYGGPIEIRP